MIDETQLSFPRGTLVEFRLHLGGGTKTCRGLVLNTAVLMARSPIGKLSLARRATPL
jgi:hypothetical protein